MLSRLLMLILRYFRYLIKVYTDFINHGAFNSVPYAFPRVPPLFTAMSMKKDAELESVYGSRTLTTILKIGDIIRILINNRDANPHPFHIHGHVFGVLAKGEGDFDNTLNSTYLQNPIRRDTVTIPGEGYAVIQFEANNPGVWFMHW
jgi:iron transport multicopper oxidase